MNPYLESCWSGIHHWLINAIARDLNSRLSTNYYAAVTVEIYQTADAEVEEGYLEIRKIGTHQLITVIEVRSPTNKQGEGRTQYETKRQNILAANCHLVEIDLLRKGQSMAFSSAAQATHYRILVSRSPDRPKADLYSFNLQELIPIFPIPLADDDPAPAIDLKMLIDGFYDIGRFAMQIDYTQDPPKPPLSEADRDWCDRVLREQGLRAE
jgi:hypothetical protein